MGIDIILSLQLKEKVRNDSLVMIANYSRPGWEVNATEVFDRIQKDVSRHHDHFSGSA